MWRLLIWSNALYRSNNIDWSLPALLFLTYHQYMYQNGMNYQILIKIRQHSWMNTSSINHISMYSHYLLFQSLFCWQHSCKGAMVLISLGNPEIGALICSNTCYLIRSRAVTNRNFLLHACATNSELLSNISTLD